MSNKIGLSSASFCLWDINAQRKINICRALGFERIEIALSTVRMLKEFASNAGFCKELKAFSSITIHAPWCRILYGHNGETKKVLKYLHQINEVFNVEAYIFHFDRIVDFTFINQSGLPIRLENSEITGLWPHFAKVLDEYAFDCVLNINRAVRNENYLTQMLKRYKHKIAAVYISGFTGGLNRTPFITSGRNYLLDQVKLLKVPFIIEGLFPPENYSLILKEKELIKEKIAAYQN